MEDITESAREKVQGVLARVENADLSTGVPSKPLLGLPIRRVIPQDVHSVLDYAGGAAGLLAASMSNTARAKAANCSLSAASAGVSALTDYKLSVAKIIPIEVHEAIDYVWGLGNVMAPFALGYYRKDKVVSFIQIAVGLGTIAASLFTDYRAYSRGSSGSRPSSSQERGTRRGQSNGHARRRRSHAKRHTKAVSKKQS